MLITADNFLIRGFSKETVDFFAEKYPHGAEFKELCEDEDFDIESIHVIWNEIDNKKEDLEHYKKRAKIEDTVTFYMSSDVKNSEIIVNSKRIEYSKNIFYSNDVMSSEKVLTSYDITNSKNIFLSNSVLTSKNICDSTKVTESKNVISSSDIIKSHSIYRSENIKGSDIIEFSHDLNSCIFSSRCSNANGLLFCYGIENANLMLFNKPIKFSQYSKIQREFSERFKDLSTCIMTPFEIKNGTALGQREIYDIREHYKVFSKEFWEWVKTLPNYSNQIMYNITFLSNFLTTKE